MSKLKFNTESKTKQASVTKETKPVQNPRHPRHKTEPPAQKTPKQTAKKTANNPSSNNMTLPDHVVEKLKQQTAAQASDTNDASSKRSDYWLANVAREYGLEDRDFLAAGFSYDHKYDAVCYPVAYPGGAAGKKLKKVKRDPKTMKRPAWHIPPGMGSGVIGNGLNVAKGKALVLAGGEEKMLASVLALPDVPAICLSAGEKRPNPELVQYIASSEPLEVIIAFDADEVGMRETQKTAAALYRAGIPTVRGVQWPQDVKPGYDLNDLLKEKGKEAVAELLNTAPVIPPSEVPEADENPYGMKSVDFTDKANAERLARVSHGHLVYVTGHKSFFHFNRKHWEKDSQSLAAMRYAKMTCTAMEMEADSLQGSSEQGGKSLWKWCASSANLMRLKAMIELVRDLPGCHLAPDALDADGSLLCVENGVLNLRTGQLRDHAPEDYITQLAGTRWDDEAECPQWLDFVDFITCGDVDLADYLQQVLGYCLSADMSEQVFFLLLGNGANGKSTFIEVVRHVLGSYGRQAEPSTLLSSNITSSSMARPELVALAGARFVAAIETERGKQLGESLIKTLTGQDRVQIRPLYGEPFEWLPVMKLFVATNHRPEVRSIDDGFWRRVRVIPFKAVIEDEQRDRYLVEKLKAEAPGILKWMYDGYCKWKDAGELVTPQVVKDAGTEYREESDILRPFLDDCCDVTDDNARTTNQSLYSAYERWCEKNAVGPVLKNTFHKLLAERGYKSVRSGSARSREGIKLLPQWQGALQANYFHP